MLDHDMPLLRPLPLEGGTLRRWRLEENWRFAWRGQVIFVPCGFIFETSVPKFFRSIYDPTGVLFIAALVHDFCYQKQYYLVEDFDMRFRVPVTRVQADELFREIAFGVYPKYKKRIWVAYKSLVMVGQAAWDNNERKPNE